MSLIILQFIKVQRDSATFNPYALTFSAIEPQVKINYSLGYFSSYFKFKQNNGRDWQRG